MKKNRFHRFVGKTPILGLTLAAAVGFLVPGAWSEANVSAVVTPAENPASRVRSEVTREDLIRRNLEELRIDSPWASLAVRELARLGAAEALPAVLALARACEDAPGERMTRIACLDALAGFDGERARRYLESVVVTSDEGVSRFYAARSLARIGDAASLDALREARTRLAGACELTHEILTEAIRRCSEEPEEADRTA